MIPVSTYSIVARDPDTGEMGVAVQSHYFSVGSIVPWVEPGVGVVATQALVEVSYGPRGLKLMSDGKSSAEALEMLLDLDEKSEVRQVAMLDCGGRVAAHTGDMCIPEAGQLIGDNYSVQANMMLNDRVWSSMAYAFEGSEGDLAERMLRSLEAAESAGGDIRGRQSSAIVIVEGEVLDRPWEGMIMDIRVEDHPDPLIELRRLVRLRRAYRHGDEGDVALEEGDSQRARAEFTVAQDLAPDKVELLFWRGVSLVNCGAVREAIPVFERVFEEGGNWAMLIPRLSRVGMLRADPDLVERIISLSLDN
ncbi:MAG: DUF1028 domain-containing protein [Theionarchaea archaeon]|nr:DUF1028 domain-containing protein [Theionarchaea archaeon]